MAHFEDKFQAEFKFQDTTIAKSTLFIHMHKQDGILGDTAAVSTHQSMTQSPS